MLKKINEKLDYILKLPRPKRVEVAKILKECYLQGRSDEAKNIKIYVMRNKPKYETRRIKVRNNGGSINNTKK